MIDFEFEFQYAEEKQPTLQKVGGSIPAGRCVVLCGGSGCGKSTLLRCINGLIPQFYEGELKGFCRLNGQDTAGIRIGEIGELAASVFQDPRSQFFTVNSSNEVAFGLENHGLPQDKIRRRVDEAFRIFHLERLKDRNVYELSSGERQLISVLSAWAMDTDIFLMDEPTANLDFAATQQLKEILFALKKQGKTLLLSEHRLYYLADIADEFWVMADGEIKGKYTAAEAKAFSVERRQTLSLRTLDLAEITVPEKEPLPKTAPTALAVSDVCYTYGRKAGDTLSMIDGKCYLSFRDGQGVPHRLELDVKLYAVFDRFELDDLSFLNEQERHLDWTELNEELLSRRSAQEPAPVEDAVYESMQTQALREGVNQLPEVQKRRLQMYFFDGLTYEEIAVREGCSYQAVQKSIAAALKKIRKFLK